MWAIGNMFEAKIKAKTFKQNICKGNENIGHQKQANLFVEAISWNLEKGNFFFLRTKRSNYNFENYDVPKEYFGW